MPIIRQLCCATQRLVHRTYSIQNTLTANGISRNLQKLMAPESNSNILAPDDISRHTHRSNSDHVPKRVHRDMPFNYSRNIHKSVVSDVLPKLVNDVPEQQDLTKRTLADLTPDERKQLKVLQLEWEVWKQMGNRVPEEMTGSRWIEILACPNNNQRQRLYRYYASLEIAENAKIKKRERKAREREIPEGPFQRNSFYFYIRSQTMGIVDNSRLAQAMQFELPLVFDLDYEDYMQHREVKNLVQQVLCSHGINKTYRNPFHFLLTGAKTGSIMDAFHTATKNTQPLEDYMFTITQKSYLDIFPKSQLIYLTPNAPNVMRRFQHDKVYIVGGFVDKNVPKPLSMARAKEQGITMEKMPIDYFLRWGLGTKSLTIDQIVGIMVEMKRCGDWETAFKYIPQRKLFKEEERRWGSGSDSPLAVHHR